MIRATPISDLDADTLQRTPTHPHRDDYTDAQWRILGSYIQKSTEEQTLPKTQNISNFYNHFDSIAALRASAGEIIGEMLGKPTEEQLLHHLSELSDELSNDPSPEDVLYQNDFHPLEYFVYYDNWGEAVDAAQSATITRPPTRENIVKALQTVPKNRLSSLETSELVSYMDCPEGVYRRLFGSVGSALFEVGVNNQNMTREDTRWYTLPYPDTSTRATYTRDDLLEYIHDAHDELGHVPTLTEMVELKPPSEGPYFRVFGSWSDALIAAGYEPNHDLRQDNDVKEQLTEMATVLNHH